MSPTPSPTALRALRLLAFPRTAAAAGTYSLPAVRASASAHTGNTNTLTSRHPPPSSRHNIHTTRTASSPPASPRTNRFAPRHTTRGPASTETTQTDFAAMDIFSSSSTPIPATSIDACIGDGFHLSNGVKTQGGSGILLLGGEGFEWRPWGASPSSSSSSSGSASDAVQPQQPPQQRQRGGGGSGSGLIDKRGLLTLPTSSLHLLTHLHPRPDLLIIGTGARLVPLHPETRKFLTTEVGMRIDVMDTANASAAYNLLATERGLGEGGVGAALLCVGWKG